MVGTGGVDFRQGRGFARSAVGVVVVALAASLALLLGRALEGLPSQLAGRIYPAPVLDQILLWTIFASF